MHFEMAGSEKNTANNTSNTGFIEIGNTKEVINQFQIPQEKVCMVIKTKYNMGMYIRADFVFTNDSLYIISSSQMNSGAMTKITVYMLPRLGDKSDYQSYLAGNEIPGFEDFLLYKVVAFCDKHNINLNTD